MKKDYGTVEGGPDKSPDKNPPPQCPVHKRAGRYAWGQFVVCVKCDEETHGTKAVEFSDDEITLDTPIPHWWGNWRKP